MITQHIQPALAFTTGLNYNGNKVLVEQKGSCADL